MLVLIIVLVIVQVVEGDWLELGVLSLVLVYSVDVEVKVFGAVQFVTNDCESSIHTYLNKHSLIFYFSKAQEIH